MGDMQRHAEAAARAFAAGASVGPVAALGDGLIHRTYSAPLDSGPGLVVQRLNTEVFANPEALMDNVVRITEYLASRDAAPGRVLRVLRTAAGETLHRDAEGGCWRAFLRIEAAAPLAAGASPAQLEAAAAGFAAYARALVDLPGPPLHVTLEGFHDFARRRGAFESAVGADRVGRAGAAEALIDGLRETCAALERALPLAHLEGLPQRTVHHDCKLDNLLFDARGREPVCVVDLDTTMPGHLVSDFGELVRSAAWGAARESEVAAIDTEAFAALCRGYARGFGRALAEAERETLPLAGAHMALMNALRFATDHLEGDVYFRLTRPGQNALRARGQLARARALLEAAPELRARFAEALGELEHDVG